MFGVAVDAQGSGGCPACGQAVTEQAGGFFCKE